ncbi:MAG: hypothetical protein NZ602_05055 [Thermoguttaceae bacterium]|nr:hypothetical protein [Thermoguttaceae bacterium]MDW8039215.1 hypothetical protein [Thermoguttaceae bacterium]
MALAVWTAGAPVVRRIRVLAKDSVGRLVWALAIGALLWATVLAGLAVLGLLFEPLIIGLTWVVNLGGVYQVLREIEKFSLSQSPASFLPRPLGLAAFKGFAQALARWSSLTCACPGSKPIGPGTSSLQERAIPSEGQSWQAEAPLPYEHAPPFDLLESGGWPFGKPEGASGGGVPSASAKLTEPADPTNILNQQTASDSWSHMDFSHWPDWVAGGGAWQRIDYPEGGLLEKGIVRGQRGDFDWWGYFLWSLAAGGVFTSLLVVLAPPTHPEVLCYHLEVPKRWLQSGGLTSLSAQPLAGPPLLVHLWFLWALALEGEVTAGLVHWQWGLLLGCSTAYLARIVLDRRWAWQAGAVVLLTPLVLQLMRVAVGDLAMATLCTLSLAASCQAFSQTNTLIKTNPVSKQASCPGQQTQWFVLAGLSFGAAVLVQPTALLMAPVLLGLWLFCGWQSPKQQPRASWPGAALAVGVCLALPMAWYSWTHWLRGNGFFLPAEQIDAGFLLSEGAEPLSKQKTSLPLLVLGWLTLPCTLTFQPEQFGGREYAVGAVWLAVLPGLLWTQRHRSIERLLFLAGGYILLWGCWQPNSRLLLPILPISSLAVVWVWSQMRRMPRGLRWVANLAMAVCLLLPVGLLGRQLRDHLPVALGVESRQEFLYRRESSYPAAALANLLFGPEAKILTQEQKTFYFDPLMVPESLYRRQSRYDQKIQHPGELAGLLRQEGFTHLLLVENLSDGRFTAGQSPGSGGENISPRSLRQEQPERGREEHLLQRAGRTGILGKSPQPEPTLVHLVEAELRLPQCGLQELSEYKFTTTDGTVRRYRLIAIR